MEKSSARRSAGGVKVAEIYWHLPVCTSRGHGRPKRLLLPLLLHALEAPLLPLLLLVESLLFKLMPLLVEPLLELLLLVKLLVEPLLLLLLLLLELFELKCHGSCCLVMPRSQIW